MALDKLIRGSALFALLAGSLKIITAFFPDRFAYMESMEILYTIIDIFLLFASLGFYLFNQHKSGLTGLIGFMIVMVGCSILIGPNESKGGINYYHIGVKVYSVGLLLFAIDSWIKNKFSKWPPIFWIGSIIVGSLGLIGYFEIFFRASGFLFGIALIVTGKEIFFKEQA